MDYIVVIPARYQSVRLPGKPLVKIDGVPMIERTYRQCLQAVEPQNILIATDDQRIFDHCQSIGANVKMTSIECETGTDRIASLLDDVNADIFINVQGDEPILDPNDLRKVIKVAQENRSVVINGYSQITDQEQFFSRTVPKVVFRPDGSLLYMSRNPVPINKAGEFKVGWRQICVYAFTREALSLYGPGKTKSPLEAIEDIEILRLLEAGIPVQMIELSGNSLAVDVPDDITRVEAILREREGT